jgi:hypothetical protein
MRKEFDDFAEDQYFHWFYHTMRAIVITTKQSIHNTTTYEIFILVHFRVKVGHMERPHQSIGFWNRRHPYKML